MTLETGVKELAEAVGADVKALEDGKVDSNDPRLSDSREWSEATVTQAEAEAGTASTRRAWTAQRVWQAINAWWQSVTSGFGRNFIASSSEQDARDMLQLTYPATAPTVGDGVGVLREGAYGFGARTSFLDQFEVDQTNTTQFISLWQNPIFGYAVGVNLPFANEGYGSQIFSEIDDATPNIKVRNKTIGVWGAPVSLYHTENLINIGTTAATARTALNLFTDSSGVITNGSGALTNDVSELLSLNTYADMSVKIQGTHNYIELPNNSSSSTPMAGYYYLLPRNNESALTHTFTCAYSATTVKTWRMLVTRSWSTSISVSPNFAVTGLSGSVKIYGTFQNEMTNVLIEFIQIGQNVTGQIVSQWS